MQPIGQPDNGNKNKNGPEDCGEFRKAYDFHWNDAPCNFRFHFLCQTSRC